MITRFMSWIFDRANVFIITAVVIGETCIQLSFVTRFENFAV